MTKEQSVKPLLALVATQSGREDSSNTNADRVYSALLVPPNGESDPVAGTLYTLQRVETTDDN